MKNNEYKESIKKSDEWRKRFNYEVFEFALCSECAYYRVVGKTHGCCQAMEDAGADGFVWGEAVCDYFLSPQGSDINGKETKRNGKIRLLAGRMGK
jgi:hypothetical protein